MNKLFLLIMLFSTLGSLAQEVADSTQWQGNWDPNDPNCPCYEVQKQAEQEYEELQQEKADSLQKIRRGNIFHRIFKKKDTKEKRIQRNKKRKKNDDCPDVSLFVRPELWVSLLRSKTLTASSKNIT